ncbi:MAG: hypothetical protein CTY20_09240 [Hyphomicrobium sp.]|nr:MAG: hypothetical protein CTY20_09240 [Hyphomicrobium sp.]
MSIDVGAFYKFVTIDDREALRGRIEAEALSLGVRGTILLAHEGINGTISGRGDNLVAFLTWLKSDPRFLELECKVAVSAAHPFKRLKVKLKPEIVTFGVPEADPSVAVGTYVAPENWNALIQDPSVLVIDTRNAYEHRIGTFDGATDPGTRTFSGFPDYVRLNLDPAKHKRIAMFCTGGIRCEKASAYMLRQGFSEVYHLDGGILKYLERISPSQSLWRGTCFVFDERVAVGHGLAEAGQGRCACCGQPLKVSLDDGRSRETALAGSNGPDCRCSDEPNALQLLCCTTPDCNDRT